MTYRYLLRTNPADRLPNAMVNLLDACGPNDPRNTVEVGDRPVVRAAQRRRLPPAANDLLWLAIAVWGIDSTASRDASADGWTRDLHLDLPLATRGWRDNVDKIEAMLGFLTGDRWTVRIKRVAPRRLTVPVPSGNTVSLLSGGLDSLIGAVDLLARDPEARDAFRSPSARRA